ESHEVLVRKIGYADFQRKVSFSAQEPRVDLTIQLEEGSSELGSGRASGAARSPTESVASPEPAAATPTEGGDKKPDFLEAIKGDKAPVAAKGSDKASEKAADKTAATGKGTLNINSVPPTTVL